MYFSYACRLFSIAQKMDQERNGNSSYTDLDLALGHAKGIREARALGAGEVFGLLERFLEREDLLAGERGPRVLLLPVLVNNHVTCNVNVYLLYIYIIV